MPQSRKPEINLEPYKEQILHFLTQKRSYAFIASRITERGTKCTARTIRRRINAWELPQRLPLEDSPEVCALVSEAYFKFNATDVQITQIIQRRLDIVLTIWGVEALRLRLGCHRRLSALQAIEAQENVTKNLTKSLSEGHIQVTTFT